MVTTRAGAARARTSQLQTSQSSEGSPTSSPISPTPSLIESINGHVYDISSFDDDLRRRAKIGLIKDDNNIRMRFCGETDDGSKYFFHLDDDITVKLEEERVPKCSCGAVKDGKACKVCNNDSAARCDTNLLRSTSFGSWVNSAQFYPRIKQFNWQRMGRV